MNWSAVLVPLVPFGPAGHGHVHIAEPAHLRLSGFFRLVTRWALVHAHSPLILLTTVAITAGAFSAFLVNDAICLVIAPLVIEVTRSLRRDPIPYLLG